MCSGIFQLAQLPLSIEMQSWTFAVALLLGLACCASPALGNEQHTDFARVGTVNFKGTKLNVFEVDGVHVADPRIAFQAGCSAVKFSRVYMKYQLSLPIRIDANTLRSTRRTSKKVGHVTITGLKVKANKGLASRESGLSVMVELASSGNSAELIFLCSSFLRCRYLREELASNPSDLGRALKFQAFGRVGSSLVNFDATTGANLPSLRCDRHRWVVFHRRVDGSLSFAQNWDAYEKGFGNPNSNYWMGLERLSAMTKTAEKNNYALTARCRLRIETESFSGKKYSAEFRMFEVLGAEQQYRLRVGLQVGKSELGNVFLNHNEFRFSTFDRDHDTHSSGSCSRLFGYGGWWYSACHGINLNGAYTTDRSITNNPTYNTVSLGGKYVPMKRSVMKFRCN